MQALCSLCTRAHRQLLFSPAVRRGVRVQKGMCKIHKKFWILIDKYVRLRYTEKCKRLQLSLQTRQKNT